MNNLTIPDIGAKKIFLFWLPLAGTWLMMAVEGPYLSAIIARMPDPKFNLAAYGVAFSFALIMEAPVIMMMSASTALVENKNSFIALRKFTFILNIIATIVFLLILIEPVFYFFALTLINLPPEVAEITHKSLIILLPWPAAIGYRRFYQGVLIKYNFTKRVAYGTFVRLVAMSLTALMLYLFTSLEGAVVGAFALTSGVVFEAIASKLMSNDAIRRINSSIQEADYKHLEQKEILKFYYPLALTSLISLGVHPIVTFFIGQSRMSLESLAVLPVINALVFIFRSIGLSYQEVAIALMGKNFKNYRPLRNFAFYLGISSAAALILIAFTPLSDIWFFHVSGLSEELTSFSIFPLQIIAIMPALTVLISMQRSLLVYNRNTSPITAATFIEVGGILLTLFISIKFFDTVGVVAAVFAFVLGRLAANGFLTLPVRKSLLKNMVTDAVK